MREGGGQKRKNSSITFVPDRVVHFGDVLDIASVGIRLQVHLLWVYYRHEIEHEPVLRDASYVRVVLCALGVLLSSFPTYLNTVSRVLIQNKLVEKLVCIAKRKSAR
jgi:hypothetical protein